MTPAQSLANQKTLKIYPRAIVLLNNIPFKYVSIQITTTTFYYADSFRIVAPANQQLPVFNNLYWANATEFYFQIYVGYVSNPNQFATSDLDLIFSGDADEINFDPFNATLLFTGRDNTRRLIDSLISFKFANKTASSIATYLAQLNNLTPVVTPTSTIVGIYYQNQQSLINKQTSQWDLLTFLAQQEDFVTFVDGNNLVFEPRPTDTPTPFLLPLSLPGVASTYPQAPVISLAFVRSMTLARDVSVKIRVPYNTKTGKSFSVTAAATRRRSSALPSASIVGAGRPYQQKYERVISGLTREQAQQKAQSILQNITIHEVKFVCRMPGSNALKKDSLIKVQGSDGFDQFYYVDNVIRTLDFEDGYNMEIEAKNHSVQSEVVP